MSDYEEIIRHLGGLATEQVNPRTAHIDRLSSLVIVRLINDEDRTVADAVASALPGIARVAEVYAGVLRGGGRVFYVGAGTSGRLGVLDAAECPPTFGTDPSRIVGVISGGQATLVLSAEGAEDRREAAVEDLRAHRLGGGDLVIGIAASVWTPYTLAGLEYARSVGASTALIVCNEVAQSPVTVDTLICLPVGPEVIAGSTRMKSGTAQKMTLNLISTTAMVLLGKTFGNLMVDLQVRSTKLAARSRRMLMDLLGVDLETAGDLLERSGGSVKMALAMYRLGCDRDTAERRLAEADGFLYRLFDNH
jgi:N-acetylmuramic acid 6-phosphate etherase